MGEINENYQSIKIQPKIVFGLNINVIGNIHFGSHDQEIIYPVEGVLTFHNYNTHQQKFLRLRQDVIVKQIVISPNRKYLGVLEELHSEDNLISSSVCVYDLNDLKKRKEIDLKELIKISEIAIISFITDSNAILALLKSPNERIYIFLFDSERTIIRGYPKLNNKNCTVECISCNPKYSYTIAVGGRNLLKIMKKDDEKGFLINDINIKCNGIYITSIMWISNELIVAGTNNGFILFIEHDEIKSKFDAAFATVFDLSVETEHESNTSYYNFNENNDNDNDEYKEEDKVACMTSMHNAFVYAIFNTIYVFRNITKFKFVRQTILRIEFGSFPKELYQIMNISINIKEDKIVCTAKHAQIYIGVLFPETEIYKTVTSELKLLGENLHTDEITGIAICAWKPIIMTASKDQTVRIWNYETEKVELVKKYQVDITIIELNPMGVLAAIGFWSQLRLMKVYVDDLIIVKTYNFLDCHDAKFSSYGHFLATAYQNLITITSVFNFEVITTLKGHFANVLSIAWSKCDRYIASGGADGAVYLWDIRIGTRVQEFVNKGIQYPFVMPISDNTTILSLTNTGIFRQISNSKLECEINSSLLQQKDDLSLLSMTVSRSEQILFISSNKGHIFHIQLPIKSLQSSNQIVNFRYFNSAVTKIKITYDDRYLITASKNGTLVIWIIKTNTVSSIGIGDGHPPSSSEYATTVVPSSTTTVAKSIDQDLLKSTDVLVPRLYLLERNQTINDLESRIKQQNIEFRNQQSEYDDRINSEIQELTKTYEKIINDYDNRIMELQIRKIDELKLKSNEIQQLKLKHAEFVKILNDQFVEKLNIEKNQLKIYENKESQLRNDYEIKLQQTTTCLQESIEAIENDFKKQNKELQDLIKYLMKELSDKKEEFEKLHETIDSDNDRLMISLKKNYEKKLKVEKDSLKKRDKEYGLLQLKFNENKKEFEKLQKENQSMNDQLKKYDKRIESLLEKVRKLEDQEIRILMKKIHQLEEELVEKDLIINQKEKQIEFFKEIQDDNNELEICKIDDDNGNDDHHEENPSYSHQNDDLLSSSLTSSKFNQRRRSRRISAKIQIQMYNEDHNNSNNDGNYAHYCDNNSLDDNDLNNRKDTLIKNFEKRKILELEQQLSNILCDIHRLLQNSISNNFTLSNIKDHIRKLHRKYIKNNTKLIYDSIENEHVENEFLRQRIYLENKIMIEKNQKDSDRKNYESIINKLIKEKSFLIQELNDLKMKLSSLENKKRKV